MTTTTSDSSGLITAPPAKPRILTAKARLSLPRSYTALSRIGTSMSLSALSPSRHSTTPEMLANSSPGTAATAKPGTATGRVEYSTETLPTRPPTRCAVSAMLPVGSPSRMT
eukprot:500263-Rhodomonas_salina.1